MNGAEVLVRTMLANGIDLCFTNPGTSEMHLVAALDGYPELRAVLALFEGVATGAADGYARLSGRPAATLLHLGPGLANGLANLHNAKKAGSPMVNIVGEHALDHLRHDAPLTSDIAGIARPVSHWFSRVENPATLEAMTREAVEVSRDGRIATLVMPADMAWSEAPQSAIAPTWSRKPPIAPSATALAGCMKALSEDPDGTLLLLGGSALLGDGANWAGAIARLSGCRVATQSLSARMTRGGDRPDFPRLPYDVDAALRFLAPVRRLILIGASLPVSFFAQPDKPGVLVSDDCSLFEPTRNGSDAGETLAALGSALGVEPLRMAPTPAHPAPEGPLTAETIGAAIAATLPEDAIVVDEAITLGRPIFLATTRAPNHDWLGNVGGAIGFGLPVAIGAAMACPERRVLAMIGDGSAFYTEQALWTMVREQLDITVVIFANRQYAILRNEWRRMGAGPNSTDLPPRAHSMLSLDNPSPDWVLIARGHGMDAVRVETSESLAAQLQSSHCSAGPRLIEVLL